MLRIHLKRRQSLQLSLASDRPRLQLALQNKQPLALTLHPVRTIGAEGADLYEGGHEVTPSFAEQTLDTGGKIVLEDLLVRPIPVERVANPSGGYTIIVGG